MRTVKAIIVALAALFICTGASAAKLNLQNGLSAGKALYSLYTQYKADGKKLDLSNQSNITNLISLVTNIKGLTAESTTSNTAASFLSGLISGSSNLVTKSNSNSVLSALGSIANLDVSSLAANAASSAASSAVSSLLKKASGSTTTSTSNTNSNTVASTASTVLSSLFSKLK